jgi:two-component system, NarL family, sensor histidine kinase BarA
MNQPYQKPEDGSSVLQRTFALGELLDLDSFRDVCSSYAELFQIGFRILDERGEKLIDARGSASEYCAYLFNFPAGKTRCMQEVSRLRDQELPGVDPIQHDCFTGLRYLVVPIVHEGSAVGRILYGPFLPAEAQPQPLPSGEFGEKFNPEQAARLLSQVRRVPAEIAQRVVGHLARVIEVMLYTGYKQALTSRMHVEAVTAGYNELQEKNRALQESFERLKELDRLKSSFLATVSHELRTPLTSVIGYSEMLIEGLAGELNTEQRDYVQTIMDKGDNLLSLITSILDFSKIESGNLRLAKGPTNLTDVIRAAVTTVIPMGRKLNVSVEYSIADDMPSIRADAEKVRQVLVNLLGNAVKFNRKDGKVLVRAECVTRESQGDASGILPAALGQALELVVRIVISDTGIGIPADKLSRIFDSFYQVDGSSTREYGGTGLGLAIAKNYVEAHDGSIDVSSEYGKGTTFTILLPVEPSA